MIRILKNVSIIATMNDDGDELLNQDIKIENDKIVEIGSNLTADGAQIEDLSGRIITPGLVNTHHHLSQSLTRAVPECQDALLFGWLQTLYPIWGRMHARHFAIAAKTGLAELLLSGCTMSSDHHYIYPNDVSLDDDIEVALQLGIRFHATRGAMSIGQSQGGLPPDHLVEKEPEILRDMERVISQYHDPAANARIKIALAPCSPFTVSTDLMRESALLAREKKVMLHTHLAENDEDIEYSIAHFGMRPGEYAESLGWVGDDVWHAHCVKLDEKEIDLFAHTRTGVAHCPCSNCRLGSGIAPIRAMRDAGVKIGLGVDGSASNDSGNILQETRQAMLLQRVKNGADQMSAREALSIATRGGAQVLGRADSIGQIKVGMCADLAIWNLDSIGAAGAWDPIAALVLCGPFFPEQVIVAGEDVVREGQLVKADQIEIAQKQREAVAEIMA